MGRAAGARLALGDEDLNDHDHRRLDPVLAAAVGKLDPTGSTRVRRQDQGKALASSSTLNRLELTPEEASSWQTMSWRERTRSRAKTDALAPRDRRPRPLVSDAG